MTDKMIDNRPTELLCKLLEERGLSCQTNYLHVSWRVWPKLYDAVDNLDGTLTVDNLTPEQAIAATLGSEPPYGELLRCLENDWNIRASWDGLRKFWCIELTDEGVKLRDAAHDTLTAEQVMKTAGRHQPDYCSDTHVCFDWQAIADELNAELGGGTCEYVIEDNMNESEGMGDVWFRCTNCCTCYDYYADDWLLKMPYCPKCGAIVEGVR